MVAGYLTEGPITFQQPPSLRECQQPAGPITIEAGEDGSHVVRSKVFYNRWTLVTLMCQCKSIALTSKGMGRVHSGDKYESPEPRNRDLDYSMFPAPVWEQFG